MAPPAFFARQSGSRDQQRQRVQIPQFVRLRAPPSLIYEAPEIRVVQWRPLILSRFAECQLLSNITSRIFVRVAQAGDGFVVAFGGSLSAAEEFPGSGAGLPGSAAPLRFTPVHLRSSPVPHVRRKPVLRAGNCWPSDWPHARPSLAVSPAAYRPAREVRPKDRSLLRPSCNAPQGRRGPCRSPDPGHSPRTSRKSAEPFLQKLFALLGHVQIDMRALCPMHFADNGARDDVP